MHCYIPKPFKFRVPPNSSWPVLAGVLARPRAMLLRQKGAPWRLCALGLAQILYYVHAQVSTATSWSLHHCSTLCCVHLSEQLMAKCSEVASRSKLLSNSKNGSCNLPASSSVDLCAGSRSSLMIIRRNLPQGRGFVTFKTILFGWSHELFYHACKTGCLSCTQNWMNQQHWKKCCSHRRKILLFYPFFKTLLLCFDKWSNWLLGERF